ncbi:hypothetical protein R1flu_007922 [Riccia fluitans]|uniref:Uncharacterized protein n=1 Tax=Riccia fluitans TaxID=41844 RepID=A0ABD1Z135_9MARC
MWVKAFSSSVPSHRQRMWRLDNLAIDPVGEFLCGASSPAGRIVFSSLSLVGFSRWLHNFTRLSSGHG